MALLGKKKSNIGNDIKKLSRAELLEMLIEQTRLADRLRIRNRKLAKQVLIYRARLERAASLQILINRLEKLERIAALQAGVTEEELALLDIMVEPDKGGRAVAGAASSTGAEPKKQEESGVESDVEGMDTPDTEPTEDSSAEAGTEVSDEPESDSEAGNQTGADFVLEKKDLNETHPGEDMEPHEKAVPGIQGEPKLESDEAKSAEDEPKSEPGADKVEGTWEEPEPEVEPDDEEDIQGEPESDEAEDAEKEPELEPEHETDEKDETQGQSESGQEEDTENKEEAEPASHKSRGPWQFKPQGWVR